VAREARLSPESRVIADMARDRKNPNPPRRRGNTENSQGQASPRPAMIAKIGGSAKIRVIEKHKNLRAAQAELRRLLKTE